MSNQLLTSREVAACLEVTVSTVNRWAREGVLAPVMQIQGYKGSRLWHPSDVDALAEERHE